MKSSPSIWNLLHNAKLMVKILSIFVAFLENMNMNFFIYLKCPNFVVLLLFDFIKVLSFIRESLKLKKQEWF